MSLKESGNKIYRWVLAIIFAGLAIRYIDWNSVISYVQTKHLLAIILVQPIQLLILLFLAKRFAVLSEGMQHGKRFYFRAYILSVGLNSFIPGRLSEIIKISYMREKCKLPSAYTISGLLLERAIDIIFLCALILSGVGIIWVNINLIHISAILILVIFFLSLLPKIAFFVSHRISYNEQNKKYKYFFDVVSQLSNRIKNKEFMFAIILSVVVWLLSFLLVYLVLKVLHGAEINLYGSIIIFSSLTLSRIIPGLPAGVGIFEAAVIFSMNYLGFDTSESLVTALTLHTSQLIFVTLAALLIMGKDGTGILSFINQKDLEHDKSI